MNIFNKQLKDELIILSTESQTVNSSTIEQKRFRTHDILIITIRIDEINILIHTSILFKKYNFKTHILKKSKSHNEF